MMRILLTIYLCLAAAATASEQRDMDISPDTLRGAVYAGNFESAEATLAAAQTMYRAGLVDAEETRALYTLFDTANPAFITFAGDWVEMMPTLITNNFAIDADRQAITGHSMGGHGALTLAMGLSGRYRSVSAFAPISNPTASDWGRKQLSAYLGDDESKWVGHDAALLMREAGFNGPVLTDTGTNDQFIDLLKPEALAEACAARRQQATLRMQPGYDHSYFFVSTFMEDHVAFHAEALYAG